MGWTRGWARCAGVLALWVAPVSLAWADVPAAALQFLRMSQPAAAWTEVSRLLVTRPDDPDLYAVAGAALAAAGDYADAVVWFDLALGSAWLDGEGRRSYADALREVGRADEAVLLRQDILLQARTEGARIAAAAGLVEDLRRAGRHAEAEIAADEALASHPRAAIIHATLADLALDRGDREAAEYHLWMVDHLGAPVFRARLVEARLCLLEGDTECVARVGRETRRSHSRDPRIRALEAEAWLLEGRPEDVLELLQQPRFRLQQHPELLSVEVCARADLGDAAAAAAVRRRLEALYPGHPATARASACPPVKAAGG